MTTRDRAVGMLVSAAFAAVCAAWFLERQGRIDAEAGAEVSRVLAQRASRERRELAARTAARPPDSERADSDPPAAPVAPPVEAPSAPETVLQEPPLTQADPPPTAAAESPDLTALLKGEAALDNPAETLARLYEAWVESSDNPSRLAMLRFQDGLRKRILELARERPFDSEEVIERLLVTATPGTELHNTLFLALLFAGGSRATEYVRSALRSSDPVVRADAVPRIYALPEGERIETWRELMRHPDRAIRDSALRSGAGTGPEWAKPLEEAASVESEPGRKGEILALAYRASPTLERLHPLLHELESSQDTDFRLAIMKGLEGTLTIRDRAAIALLRRIAENPAEPEIARSSSFGMLLKTGSALLTPEEEESVRNAQMEMYEARSGPLHGQGGQQ